MSAVSAGLQSVPAMPRASRPGVAVLCNSLPPYRLYLHRRIFREVPEIKLWTVLTHEADERWPLVAPPELGLVSFGKGESGANQANPLFAMHEWRKGGRIVRWLAEQGISAVVMLGYNDPGRLRVLNWCRRKGVPCFIWGDSNINDDASRGAKAILKRAILTPLLRQATGVLPCGRLGKAYFARYGVPADRMFVFPNDADTQLFLGLSAEEIAGYCRRFGLAPGRRRLLFSGRLVEVKRVDQLIEAFKAIASRRPDWDLVIAGDGALAAELRRQVPDSLSARVSWLGHLPDQAALGAVYRSCDVLVLPSRNDAWALVIQEAVATGMAVVSSSVPGAAAELVRDGVNGRIYPSGDVAALIECLLAVTEPDRIDSMKAASAAVIADWRRDSDPILGLRKALRYAGVLSA